MKKIFLLSVLILSTAFILVGCQYGSRDKATRNTTSLDGFCGTSIKAQCQNDADCTSSGCSGQVCGKVGEGVDTTCEYTDCYNKTKYGVACGCVNGQCQWYK